jgi:hypothetical protein
VTRSLLKLTFIPPSIIQSAKIRLYSVRGDGDAETHLIDLIDYSSPTKDYISLYIFWASVEFAPESPLPSPLTSEELCLVRWNHVSDHALTVLGIAPPELYINPLALHYFMYFRQLLI